MRLFITILATLVLSLSAAAQTTFAVTVANKTAQHPAFGQGHSEGYVVNGAQGASLTLTRGQTYVFRMLNVPAIHPFYITTSSTGGGTAAWNVGVVGNFATGTAELTFTVPESAPDELWYQCGAHAMMGGRITVVSATDVEGELPGVSFAVVSANPVRDAIRVRLSTAAATDARLAVFTVDGRRVAVLHDGPLTGSAEHAFGLDASGLAAGVYVVRATIGEWTAERRVTVIR